MSLGNNNNYQHPLYLNIIASSSTISTISPNDDNESLYLLWTHQLLKEKGYHINDDEESTESSITQASSKTNWFRTCFPICY